MWHPSRKLTHRVLATHARGDHLKAVDSDSPHRKQNVKAGLLCVAVLEKAVIVGRQGKNPRHRKVWDGTEQ